MPITADHTFIKEWIEKRGGKPARVRGTGIGEDVGLLRVTFKENEESLEKISWDEFFEKFDEKGLAFLYQDTTGEGKESRFFKLIKRK